MSQRNPIKSEFFTFVGGTAGKRQESGDGENFFAVNVSGSREVIFSTNQIGAWYVTNQSYNEVLEATPEIRDDAQIMPLPACTSSRSGQFSNHLVVHTNDDMLYVFVDPDAELEEFATKCYVWVIR